MAASSAGDVPELIQIGRLQKSNIELAQQKSSFRTVFAAAFFDEGFNGLMAKDRVRTFLMAATAACYLLFVPLLLLNDARQVCGAAAATLSVNEVYLNTMPFNIPGIPCVACNHITHMNGESAALAHTAQSHAARTTKWRAAALLRPSEG
jgi:hypothetical protein